jgi:SAM-dependent methyltransferase
MTVAGAPLDTVGSETLDIMSQAPNYNAWQFSRIAPFLGRRVCEIGSGIGNMSAHFLRHPHELLLLTDTDPFYLERLRARFMGQGTVRVERLSLPEPLAAERFRSYRLDTVVALNVVEHITPDDPALATMASMVGRGGRVIVLVPALPLLYGSLDRELGHARRYTRRSLGSALERAGCALERVFYFNMVGVFGWWLNARVMQASRIPSAQLGWFDRLVPLWRLEDALPRPFGQSVIGIGTVR